MGHGIDHLRFDQGLVALHVDHQVGVGQTQDFTRLGQTVAARDVVGSGQKGRDVVRQASFNNALIVGCYHHLGGLAQLSPLRHPHHHGQACNIGQWLAGQAG